MSLTINNQTVHSEEGSTLLKAARQQGIEIPTLCHFNGFTPHTSCMICVVYDVRTDRLVPSCSMPVEDGMIIETENELVLEARKDTLDLLLSEHVGDCQAPCQRACPANMNIPLMIRQIKDKRFDDALITVKQDIALPAVLGRICPAPCENGCNRKFHDEPVSICHLKRFVADVDLAGTDPFQPNIEEKTGKKIAVIGAGPAGLSAAYYLALKGHDCFLFDQHEQPGGLLRYGVPKDRLPERVLDDEIEQILRLSVKTFPRQTLMKDFNLTELRGDYDAVILAVGQSPQALFEDTGIKFSPRGIVVNRQTFETTVSGVFTGGNTIAEGKIAIRSAAHGKNMAISVDQFVKGEAVTGAAVPFNSILGKLQEGESAEFLMEAQPHDRIDYSAGFEAGYSPEEAVKESQRCFHCDCRKLDTCKLRIYSEIFGGDQKRFKYGQRKKVQKIVQHDLIIFEPGKCIKCNLCVEITRKAREKFGFTFINRGFDVQISIPFHESLKNGLQRVAGECALACPTAALAMKDEDARTGN